MWQAKHLKLIGMCRVIPMVVTGRNTYMATGFSRGQSMLESSRRGIWKSGNGKGGIRPKGRQVSDSALSEIRKLLGDRPRRRDLLIEFLHLIQDEYRCLSAAHLAALAEEMKLSQAEVYEVATFYAHFDVVKEGEGVPPGITIRVCDSLSCELAGAQELLRDLLREHESGGGVRVVRAPCMGRCDTAPTLEIGHNHIDHATPKKVRAAIRARDFIRAYRITRICPHILPEAGTTNSRHFAPDPGLPMNCRKTFRRAG